MNRPKYTWGGVERDCPRVVSTTGVDLTGIEVDDNTEWEDDYTCRALVAMHPQGMTLHEIGAVLRSQSRRGALPGSSQDRRRRRSGMAPAPAVHKPRPIGRERVRQIEAAAIRKLKRHPEAKELLEIMAMRTHTETLDDHAWSGEWPTHADNRRLQNHGQKGAWGWDGEARPQVASPLRTLYTARSGPPRKDP